MIYGLNEIQSAELILLILTSGLIVGSFIGLIVRAANKLFR